MTIDNVGKVGAVKSGLCNFATNPIAPVSKIESGFNFFAEKDENKNNNLFDNLNSAVNTSFLNLIASTQGNKSGSGGNNGIVGCEVSGVAA